MISCDALDLDLSKCVEAVHGGYADAVVLATRCGLLLPDNPCATAVHFCRSGPVDLAKALAFEATWRHRCARLSNPVLPIRRTSRRLQRNACPAVGPTKSRLAVGRSRINCQMIPGSVERRRERACIPERKGRKKIMRHDKWQPHGPETHSSPIEPYRDIRRHDRPPLWAVADPSWRTDTVGGGQVITVKKLEG